VALVLMVNIHGSLPEKSQPMTLTQIIGIGVANAAKKACNTNLREVQSSPWGKNSNLPND
jgi:hypothetical protein